MLFAPQTLPVAVIKALNNVTETALGDATLRENFAKGSLEGMAGGPPEALSTLAQEDSAKYGRLVRELNIPAG